MALLLHGGWSPASVWIGALWAQGVGLGVATAAFQTSDPSGLYFPLLVAGAAFGATAVFFGLALPEPDAHAHEGLLADVAIGFFKRLPRPRPWVRMSAIAAAVLPFWVRESSVPLILWLVAGSLLYGYGVRRQPTGSIVTRWDKAGPWVFCWLSAAYALSLASTRHSFTMGQAFAGLALSWFAQALLLRHTAARQWAELVALGKITAAEIPLKDYVSETESLTLVRHAPSERTVDETGAVLMESGTFRVDATRMLEKLSERQLEEAGDFILAWLRCAVASGAHLIEVHPSPWTLRFEFDGRPFSKSQMADPYRALLDTEAEDADRGAQFAYGLLAALRLKPSAIWVVSGEGAQRSRTVLAAPGVEESPPADPGGGTLVEARFAGPLGFLRPYLAARRGRSTFGHSSARLRVSDSEVRPAEYRETRSVDGWNFAWTPTPFSQASRIAVYHLGVRVEELDHKIAGGPQVEAAISHPDLRLSLSQSAVVRDATFAQGLRRLERVAAGQPEPD